MGQREDFLLSAQSNSGAINRIMLIDPASSTIPVSAPRVNTGTRADLPESGQEWRVHDRPRLERHQAGPVSGLYAVKAQNRVQFVLELDADFRSLVGLSALPRANDGVHDDRRP